MCRRRRSCRTRAAALEGCCGLVVPPASWTAGRRRIEVMTAPFTTALDSLGVMVVVGSKASGRSRSRQGGQELVELVPFGGSLLTINFFREFFFVRLPPEGLETGQFEPDGLDLRLLGTAPGLCLTAAATAFRLFLKLVVECLDIDSTLLQDLLAWLGGAKGIGLSAMTVAATGRCLLTRCNRRSIGTRFQLSRRSERERKDGT